AALRLWPGGVTIAIFWGSLILLCPLVAWFVFDVVHWPRKVHAAVAAFLLPIAVLVYLHLPWRLALVSTSPTPSPTSARSEAIRVEPKPPRNTTQVVTKIVYLPSTSPPFVRSERGPQSYSKSTIAFPTKA